MTRTSRSTSSWMAVPVALFLSTAALAGCIGVLAHTSTGLEHQGTAAERADTLADDAELVHVFGAETGQGNGLQGSSLSHQFNASYGEVGDGQAPTWVYGYESDEDAFDVVVAANGTVLDVQEKPHRNTTPVSGWNVDSSEASDIAREHDRSWAALDPSQAWYALGQDEDRGDPVWVLGAFDRDRAWSIAVINANTGAYLGSWEAGFGGDGSWGSSWNGSAAWTETGPGMEANRGPPEESGSVEGTLTVIDPEKEHTFEIEHGGHDVLGVSLELDGSLWSSVTAEVDGPQGANAALEAGAVEDEDHDKLHMPSPGTYTVTVTFEQGPLLLEEGAVQDYVFRWCAPGSSLGGSYGEEPSC